MAKQDKLTIYDNGLEGTLKYIPSDLAVTPSIAKKYEYRTPGGALLFHATRKDDPRDEQGKYFGAWEDTTALQWAKEHKGKERQPRVSVPQPSREEELAKAQALLAALMEG